MGKITTTLDICSRFVQEICIIHAPNLYSRILGVKRLNCESILGMFIANKISIKYGKCLDIPNFVEKAGIGSKNAGIQSQNAGIGKVVEFDHFKIGTSNVYPSIYTNDCGAAEMPYSASVLGVSNFCSSPNW